MQKQFEIYISFEYYVCIPSSRQRIPEDEYRGSDVWGRFSITDSFCLSSGKKHRTVGHNIIKNTAIRYSTTEKSKVNKSQLYLAISNIFSAVVLPATLDQCTFR